MSKMIKIDEEYKNGLKILARDSVKARSRRQ